MMIRTPIASLLLCLSLSAAPNSAPQAPDITTYDAVLKEFVLDDGRVRYGALRSSIASLETFVNQIAAVSPRSHPELFPSRAAQLAYWINAYNGLVLLAFAREYPEKKGRLEGLIGRGLFFYRKKFPVGGENLSLAKIENGIIREEFNEPKIHFALVCASASCPELSRQGYTAQNLQEQLETETRRFLNQDRNVHIDPERRRVTLSKLFDWYGKDFGGSAKERLAFVARYRQGGAILSEGKWEISYFDYDWSPNDALPRGPSTRNTPSANR